MALVAEVKNRPALKQSLEKLVNRANQALRDAPPQIGGITIGSIAPLKNGETGYVLSFAGSEIPVASGLRPTLLLGDHTLVLASTPAMARKARDFAETHNQSGVPPGDPLASALDWLPSNMGLTMVAVADTARSVYPELLVGLPGLAESLIRSRRFLPFPFVFAGGLPQLDVDLSAAAVVGRAGSVRPPAAPAPWDAELVPDPDDLRPFLFPSVQALAVDETGIQFLSREAIPTLNASTLVPVALAALVPAIRSAHLTIDRSRSNGNLTQIGQAVQKYHDVNKHFPADIRGKDAKPVLSWRVAILPYVGQGELFRQFRLDEPWDSPHNNALLARMPPVFAIGDEPGADQGHTFYRGFSGKGAFFDPREPEGVTMAQILDGTSNTAAVVEARAAVPWTKPESDLKFENDAVNSRPEKTKALLEQLGGHNKSGFNVLFCDGSVRFVPGTASVVTIQAMITLAAGEVITTE